MNTFITIMGWLSVTATAVAIAAFLVSVAFYGAAHIMDSLKERGASEERMRWCAKLQSESHWFSEHKPTSTLLKRMADDMAAGCSAGVSSMRDEWRQWMIEEKQK